MFTPHAPSLDVYLLGCGGTLIYSLSVVCVWSFLVMACVTFWRTQCVSTNPHTRTLLVYSRVVDAGADVDL